jgi:alpha-glucosidase
MIVAPVVEEGTTSRNVTLPDGDWVHLWSGDVFAKGTYDIAAPHGQPPVFTRKGSTHASLFSAITREFRS